MKSAMRHGHHWGHHQQSQGEAGDPGRAAGAAQLGPGPRLLPQGLAAEAFFFPLLPGRSRTSRGDQSGAPGPAGTCHDQKWGVSPRMEDTSPRAACPQQGVHTAPVNEPGHNLLLLPMCSGCRTGWHPRPYPPAVSQGWRSQASPGPVRAKNARGWGCLSMSETQENTASQWAGPGQTHQQSREPMIAWHTGRQLAHGTGPDGGCAVLRLWSR